MVSPTEKQLTQRKKEIPLEIISLVAPEHRFSCKKLLDEFEQVVTVMARGPFAKCDRPIDAIVMLLRDQGPMKKVDIVKAVISGGYRGGDADRASDIGASIEVFMSGRSYKTENGLKLVNKLVGLKDWPDELFHAT